MWTKRIRLLFLGVCAAGALTTLSLTMAPGKAAIDPESAAPESAKPLPVGVTVASYQPSYGVRRAYAGRIVAGRSSALGFQRGGLLVDVAVDEGARVDAGQILARLDVRALEARRDELGAALEHGRATRNEVRARLDLAKKTAQRRKVLMEKGHTARQRYDEAVAEQDALAAQLGATRAAIKETRTALKSVDVDIDLSVLRAPFAGTVVARSADEGTALRAGEAVLRLIEDTALEARVGVPPRAAATLVPGDTYDVTVDGTARPATLRAVLPEVDPSTRTVFAIFTFDPALRGLRAGQIGRLVLDRAVGDGGFWLPVSALAEGDRGLWTAYAVVGGGTETLRTEKRPLTLLHAESDRVFVRGALDDGDRVVVSGLHRLVPGQTIEIR